VPRPLYPVVLGHRVRHVLRALGLAIVVLLLGPVAAAAAAVAVFPIPGTTYNRPQTQITFRGVAAGAIGPVQVVGSQTGVHADHIEADSDGQGGSFVPDQPFAAGETVTVNTDLDVQGSSNGTFSFQIAQPWGLLPYGKLPLVSGGAGSVQYFHSRPDLQPAAVDVTENRAPATEGDIFVAPQFGPKEPRAHLRPLPCQLDCRGRERRPAGVDAKHLGRVRDRPADWSGGVDARR
jgi:hypothetical protein